jgi:hypothetical protein
MWILFARRLRHPVHGCCAQGLHYNAHSSRSHVSSNYRLVLNTVANFLFMLEI